MVRCCDWDPVPHVTLQAPKLAHGLTTQLIIGLKSGVGFSPETLYPGRFCAMMLANVVLRIVANSAVVNMPGTSNHHGSAARRRVN